MCVILSDERIQITVETKSFICPVSPRTQEDGSEGYFRSSQGVFLATIASQLVRPDFCKAISSSECYKIKLN